MRHATITYAITPHRTLVIGTITVTGGPVLVEWRDAAELPPMVVGYQRQTRWQFRRWIEQGLPPPDEGIPPHDERFWDGVRSCLRWRVRLGPFRRGPP